MSLDFANEPATAPVVLVGAMNGATINQLDQIKFGQITVVAAPKRDYDDYGKPLPQAGEYGVIVDMSNKPALAVKVTKVTVARFLDIDDETARAIGEENKDRWISNARSKIGAHGGWSAFMDMVFCTVECTKSL